MTTQQAPTLASVYAALAHGSVPFMTATQVLAAVYPQKPRTHRQYTAVVKALKALQSAGSVQSVRVPSTVIVWWATARIAPTVKQEGE